MVYQNWPLIAMYPQIYIASIIICQKEPHKN